MKLQKKKIEIEDYRKLWGSGIWEAPTISHSTDTKTYPHYLKRSEAKQQTHVYTDDMNEVTSLERVRDMRPIFVVEDSPNMSSVI